MELWLASSLGKGEINNLERVVGELQKLVVDFSLKCW